MTRTDRMGLPRAKRTKDLATRTQAADGAGVRPDRDAERAVDEHGVRNAPRGSRPIHGGDAHSGLQCALGRGQVQQEPTRWMVTRPARGEQRVGRHITP